MYRKIFAASILTAALVGLTACGSPATGAKAAGGAPAVTVTPVAAKSTVPAVCVGVPQSMMKDCTVLAARPATRTTLPDGSAEVEDPAGDAIVTDCRSQYKGEELAICLQQP